MAKEILLKSVQIVDPAGPHHQHEVDVRLKNGLIAEIGQGLKSEKSGTVLEVEGSCISIGWMDGQAHFRDPGREVMEGLDRGMAAAAAGGFTRVALLPTTEPPLDNKAAVGYLLRRAEGGPVTVHPLGTLSVAHRGGQLSELADLKEAGAVGFTDDGPATNPELLRRGLEYAAHMGLPIMATALEEGLNEGGLMHEGLTSTQMGLAGSPGCAESMRLDRDLALAKYTGGRLHIPVLTTREGVERVRVAKEDGLNVTCATTAHHLHYRDTDLAQFDGTLKVTPPFRSEDDRQALREAVLDGTIDMVVSDHRPWDLEHHNVEFMLSPDGIASIEAVFSVAVTALEAETKSDELAQLISALTTGPRAIFGLPTPVIAEGQPAELTWFHPGKEAGKIRISGGANRLIYGEKLRGSVLGTFR